MSGVTRWLIGIYASLALVAAVYALIMGNYVRTGSEFSGLALVLLALPWSVVFRGFRPRLLNSAFNTSVVVMSAYIALNMLILFALGRAMDRLLKR